MPLGIGNNLIRNGGGLNPDGLTLDLQFATDKTLTARKGPTPVLTRGTSATFVNSAGLIEYAPENLILQSENFASTTWTETGGSMSSVANIAPDGSPNSDLFTEDTLSSTHRTFQSFTGTSGTVYTLSVFLKFAGRQYVFLENRSITSNPFVVFDIQNGNVFSNLSGGSLTATIDAYPNGWYRCSVTGTANAAGGNYIIGGYSGGLQTYAGSGGPTFYAWGAQVEVGPLKSYNRTTTAAFYGPRFDHDPVSPFACRGLLIEEGRTNQWSASEDLGASPWSLINTTTLNSNNTTAPDGLTTADRFTVGSTTQEYGFFRNTFSFVSGTTYTISCYLKADQVTRVSIYAVTQATLPVDAYFDLTGNGSVTANASGTASIQRLSNGWYRCVITGTALASAITSVRINAATTGNSRNYVGNSVDSFWAWGAQLEAGAFPTSYIPTTTSALARAGDACSITGANFTSTNFFNPSAGTIAAIGILNTTNINSAPEVFKFNDGTNNNRIQIGMTNVPTEGIRPVIVASANLSYNFSTGTATVGVERKIGTAYSTNDAISVFNGTLGTQDITVTMPTGINQALIGVSSFTGTISSIRYFKKRLPNAKLQALTA